MNRLHVLPVLLLLTAPALSAAPRDIPPAFGTNINLTSANFAGCRSYGPKDQIVATYYFYWYNVHTGEHIRNADGSDALTTHPADMEDLAYTSVEWHKRQLLDMIHARIDVVLPVFWGAPSEQDAAAGLHWSYVGLQALVQARQELLDAGKRPPHIGMFYDTSTLQYNAWGEHIDLTTDYGRHWFYATIRDFFSLLPPPHWAMLYGKPIVLLYAAGFARAHDQRLIEHTREAFRQDFGGKEPWIAAEVSWQLKADSQVAWGGALGLKPTPVASLGPGYDHSAVPGRAPLVVDRRNGAFYEEQWLKLLRRPSQIAVIETWNEWHEGTDIAESREYGRHYLDLTRKYASLYKRGWSPPWPKGPFTRAKAVSITLRPENQEHGLRQIENEDGLTEPDTAAGQPGRAVKPNPHGGQYVYFAVDDSFKWDDLMQAQLELAYFDAAPGTLTAEYDGCDEEAPFHGAYTRSEDIIKLTGSHTWTNAVLRLPDARFLNAQNRGADFRLVVNAPALILDRVSLRERPYSPRPKRAKGAVVSQPGSTAPGSATPGQPAIPQRPTAIPVRPPTLPVAPTPR